MKRLSGRRIVLTGASRGIGREAVDLLSAEGAEIIGIAREASKLRALESLHPGFRALVGDVDDNGLAGRVARAVADRWGALDVLVNNAAIQHYNEGFHDEPADELERSLRTNVLGPHWLTHGLVPWLKKGVEPRIVNVSSGAGKLSALRTEPTMPAYRLSKLALNGLTILYAGDLAGVVAVNSLDPGWLKTDLGGPNAPGEPVDGARRLLDVLLQPFDVTGKFWYGAEEIEL